MTEARFRMAIDGSTLTPIVLTKNTMAFLVVGIMKHMNARTARLLFAFNYLIRCMTIDLVLTFLKDPEREYDAAEVAEGTGLAEKAILSHLRLLWRGGILERRKDNNRGRLVYRTKQAQLEGV